MFFDRKIKLNFDKAYCISYCRNIEKQHNVRKIMKYLGIPFEFIYGADYSNLNILKSNDFVFPGGAPSFEKNINFKYYTHFVGASYDHYTAVMHAYESGANSVLLIEDDCAFINNKKLIEYCLNNYPKDADIVKFGYHNWYYDLKDKHASTALKNNLFLQQTNDTNEYLGTQLYALCNRKIMKQYIDIQLHDFMCCDGLRYRMTNAKIYGLIPPIAVDETTIPIEYKNEYDLLEYIK